MININKRNFHHLCHHLGRQRTLPAAALVMVFYYYCPASKHTHLRVMPRSATPRKMQSGGVLRSLLKCLQLHFFVFTPSLSCSLSLSLLGIILFLFCFASHNRAWMGVCARDPMRDEIIERNRLPRSTFLMF